MAFDIDKSPATEEEQFELLEIISAQVGELIAVHEVRVTCPCGASEIVLLACRCHFCGVFFCRSCAARHFAGSEAKAQRDAPRGVAGKAVLAALCLLLTLALPAYAGEDAYYTMAFPDLVTAPADAHIHTHICLTGTVNKTRKEGDGDIHINLCQSRTLHLYPGPGTVESQQCVILEIIPELPVARPRKGQRIKACGIVRYDGWHRWWELHPLLSWEIAP